MRKNVQRIVLQTIAAAGVMGVAVVAPNVLGAMYKLGIPLSIRQDNTVARARKRLVEKGLLSYERGKLRLTNKGSRALKHTDFSKYGQQNIRRRWDGRWRLIVFDIPEKKRVLRDKIRNILVAVGFIRLQDSVWIYPYNCEKLITLLKAELKIGKDLLYIIADEIEYDTPYRTHFKLKGAKK